MLITRPVRASSYSKDHLSLSLRPKIDCLSGSATGKTAGSGALAVPPKAGAVNGTGDSGGELGVDVDAEEAAELNELLDQMKDPGVRCAACLSWLLPTIIACLAVKL